MNKFFLKLAFFIFLFFTFSCKSIMQINKFEKNNEIEKVVFAVLKLSYNNIGDSQLEGGICGTAFAINDSTIIATHHNFEPNLFKPNTGYNHCNLWLLNRATKIIIEFNERNITRFPDIDAVTIKLANKLPSNVKIKTTTAKTNDQIYCYGHIADCMPYIDAYWDKNLIIKDYKLENCISDKFGTIVSIKKVNVNSTDVNLDNKEVIQASFSGVIGMSGGPLISNNKIIGLLSFGYPPDAKIKTTIAAVSMNEIIKRFKKS